MTSDNQIAANRANARLSTGPKTAAGRTRSSHNAHRHGLSVPLMIDAAELAKHQTLAAALNSHDDRQHTVEELLQAQLELLRIRTIRTEMLARVDPKQDGPEALRRVLALDRFERIARTKRRRAARKL